MHNHHVDADDDRADGVVPRKRDRQHERVGSVRIIWCPTTGPMSCAKLFLPEDRCRCSPALNRPALGSVSASVPPSGN
jgi:hypothetical protein